MFRKFYISVTKLLGDSKVFPDLDDDYISTSSTVSSRQIVNDDPKAVKEKEEPTEKAEPVAASKGESEDEVLDDREDLLGELRELKEELKGRDGRKAGRRENVKMVAMPKETFAEAVRLGNVSQQEVKREQILADKSGDNDWKLELDRAARLHVGEWV